MSFPALRYVKGHGTQNDFVILDDPAADLDLSVELVAALCDRRRGIGADGVLRVATAGALRDAGVLATLPVGVKADDWFMDYRNADGSIAEMCGNGVRVFAHYLRVTGLVDADTFTVGSRAGARPATVHSFDSVDAEVTVAMGVARVHGESTVVIGGSGAESYVGLRVDVGNPHLVVNGLSAEALAAVDFTAGVGLDADDFPEGANVELLTPPVEAAGTLAAQMRVCERGVGETRSCGTGLVAAGQATLTLLGRTAGELDITIPGGRVRVTITGDGAWLRGPSKLVADGALRAGWA
ncbi:MAG: diaminopimelate epimerase [Gordonia sp. (in: high G+C Gram-positive bacteria)]